MKLPPLKLAQKIAGTITLLSISAALMLTIFFGKEITENIHESNTKFLVALSQEMQENLQANYEAMLSIEKITPENKDTINKKLWTSMLESSLSSLPQNIEAMILDAEANVIAPSQLKKAVRLDVRKQVIADAHKGPLVTDTPRGRITGITRTLAKDKFYLVFFYFHQNFEKVLWERHLILLQGTCAIVVIGIILALLLSRHLAKPLQSLNKAALALPHADMSSEHVWDTIPPLPLDRQDEIGNLAHSFKYMVDTLQKNISNTLQLKVAQEKVESELRLAQTIQQNILPKEFDQSPAQSNNTLNPSVHGIVIPAREVGGDLFDAFWLDDEHFCFAVGDVSDKGVPAALFMSITITLIRSIMRNIDEKDDPARTLEYINNTLCQDNTSNMFVSLIVGVLNCNTGELIYANAGHTPPICLKSDGFEILPTHKEMVIASFEDINYTNIKYNLKSGESIFLYTDGVNEALSATGERLGDPALHEFLLQAKALGPKALNEYIIEQIKIFSKGVPQYDDITLLNFLWHKPKI